MARIEDECKNIALAIMEKLAEENIEIVDVEFTGETKTHERYLRVFLDKPGGIEIEDCQRFSELLEEELDKRDFITEPYILEVSSPGLERVLKKPQDFEREMGKTVLVSLYAPFEGKKEYVGTLTGYDENFVTLADDVKIPKEKIAQVRLYLEI